LYCLQETSKVLHGNGPVYYTTADDRQDLRCQFIFHIVFLQATTTCAIATHGTPSAQVYVGLIATHFASHSSVFSLSYCCCEPVYVKARRYPADSLLAITVKSAMNCAHLNDSAQIQHGEHCSAQLFRATTTCQDPSFAAMSNGFPEDLAHRLYPTTVISYRNNCNAGF